MFGNLWKGRLKDSLMVIYVLQELNSKCMHMLKRTARSQGFNFCLTKY